MKHNVRGSITLASALLVTLATATVAHGKLAVTGKGKSQELVIDQFPKEHQARYLIFKERCTKCHEMARPIAALETGITPVTGSPFENPDIKMYATKMMRKANSGINKEDAQQIILFLWFARELAKK